jgi:hypothetical protein
MNWDEKLSGKSSYEVFQMINVYIKTGRWPKDKIKQYSDIVWKKHIELQKQDLKVRKETLDKLF